VIAYDCFDSALEDGVPVRWSADANMAAYIASGDATVNPTLGTYPVKRRALRVATDVSVASRALVTFDDSEHGVGTVMLACVKPQPDAKCSLTELVFLWGEHTFVGMGVFEGYVVSLYNDQHSSANVLEVSGGSLSASVPKLLDSDKAYYVKISLQFLDGSGGTVHEVKVRVWCPDDEAEPDTWDITDTDSTYIGKTGVFGFGTATAESTLRGGDLNFVSINSSGASVRHALAGDFRDTFEPITNTEFNTWADAPNARCWAVKLTAVGYSPTGAGSPTVYTRDVPVYMSTQGFATKEWDYPQNTRFLPIVERPPEFAREMTQQMRGRVQTQIGEVIVANPRGAMGEGGVRDHWLRMKWKKNFAVVMLGDPSWSLADFRTMILGRVQRPLAPRPDVIAFQIADLSDYFKEDVNPDRLVTDTPNDEQRVPRAFGKAAWSGEGLHQRVEPPRTDEANPVYTVCQESFADFWDNSALYIHAYDDNVEIRAAAQAVTCAPGASVLTTPADHGALEGWCAFLDGSVVSPWVADQKYYVVGYGSPTAITGDTFALSLTPGGAPITNGGSTLNCTVHLLGYDVDTTGPTVLTLVSEPVGRVTVAGTAPPLLPVAPVEDTYRSVAEAAGMPDCLVDPECTTEGLSATNPNHFLWVGTEKTSCEQVLERLAGGTLTWWNVAPEGAFQFGALLLPEDVSGDPVLELNESNCRGLVQTGLVLPVDFSKAEVRYYPWFLRGGPIQGDDGDAPLNGYYIETPATMVNPEAATAPLDAFPQVGEMNTAFRMEKLLTGDSQYERTLHLYSLGIFQVRAKLSAFRVPIGAKVQLTHSRLGWKYYDGVSDLVSPDNGEAFDGREAIVMGVAVRPDKSDMFPVVLTLMRRVPGYYPTDEEIAGLFFLLLEDGSFLLQEDGSSRVYLEHPAMGV
jgi:hypothetical protein